MDSTALNSGVDVKLSAGSSSARKVPADLIAVGHITGSYGVQGWVRIHPYSVQADALLHVKTWWLAKSAFSPSQGKSTAQKQAFSVPGSTGSAKASVSAPVPELRDVEKLEAKLHGEDVVARLIGVVGRDAAQALKGTVVHIPRSHFPALPDGEFYWLDLIGLAVDNCEGESLGQVADLIDNGAHPILRVVAASAAKTEIESETEIQTRVAVADAAKEYLIPFVERFVPTVDLKNKKIIVDWGLDY